jgi:hypothetical protein
VGLGVCVKVMVAVFVGMGVGLELEGLQADRIKLRMMSGDHLFKMYSI